MVGQACTATPPVTVVITACGDDRGLRETIESIGHQTRAIGAELLLIFNVWPDDIPKATRDLFAKQVDTLLFEPRPGKSIALNTAAHAALADIVAFTDDDAIPSLQWLENLLKPMERDPSLAGVGGPVEPVFPASGIPAWYRRLTVRRDSHFLGPKHYMGPEPVEYELPKGDSIGPVPLGANVAWRRDWILRFPFREDLGPNRATGLRGGEDSCFALQVMEAGGRVAYAPRAIVHHPVDPCRMTHEFVMGGFDVQGLEFARIMKALDRSPVDTARLVSTAKPQPLRDALRRLGPRQHRIKRGLKRAYAQRACEELQLGASE